MTRSLARDASCSCALENGRWARPPGQGGMERQRTLARQCQIGVLQGMGEWAKEREQKVKKNLAKPLSSPPTHARKMPRTRVYEFFMFRSGVWDPSQYTSLLYSITPTRRTSPSHSHACEPVISITCSPLPGVRNSNSRGAMPSLSGGPMVWHETYLLSLAHSTALANGPQGHASALYQRRSKRQIRVK